MCDFNNIVRPVFVGFFGNLELNFCTIIIQVCMLCDQFELLLLFVDF